MSKPFSITRYGPGDPQTWPPYAGHANDPRAEECPRELGGECDGCVYSGSCALQDMFAAEAEAEQ